jgi:UDP-N-acetylmuramyl pentapeptide synthase
VIEKIEGVVALLKPEILAVANVHPLYLKALKSSLCGA